jgi:hypothetical protein
MKNLIQRHLDEWNGIQIGTPTDPDLPIAGAPAPEPPFGTEPPIQTAFTPFAHFT